MKNLWGIAFGVVCGLLGAGLLLLAVAKPRGEPIRLIPPPTPAPAVVHVAGAVNAPGVHVLPHGARVMDAIEKSGGLADTADPDLLNLAEPVRDGMQIWVPELQVDQGGSSSSGQASQEGLDIHPADVTNINTASQAELETLPGIGPAKAQAIIQYRQENGPFKEIADIQSVSGIGPVIFENLRARITVGGAKSDH